MIKSQNHEAISTNKITSITELITDAENTVKESEIKRLFQIRQLPCFSISDLKNSQLFIKNGIFHKMVIMLDRWNSKISKLEQSTTCRAQFFRNQFIFSSLKSIMVQNTNVDRNLKELEVWLQKNSNEKAVVIRPKTRLTSQIDDDWEIRKNYRSNMPMELHNYQRRQLTATRRDQKGAKPVSLIKKDNQVQSLQQKNAKMVTSWAQYKLYQQRERRKRQQQQINHAVSDWKQSKSRFQQIISKNYYKHKFPNSGKWRDSKDQFQIKKGAGFGYLTQRNSTLDQIKLIKIKRKNLGRKKNGQEQLASWLSDKQNVTFSIDGVSLTSNPFEVKSRTKKKMKRKPK